MWISEFFKKRRNEKLLLEICRGLLAYDKYLTNNHAEDWLRSFSGERPKIIRGAFALWAQISWGIDERAPDILELRNMTTTIKAKYWIYRDICR